SNSTHESAGDLPIIEKPNLLNPTTRFIATANQNVTPEDYERWEAIGYSWSDPYRGDRINGVLAQDKQFTLEEMRQLQVDYTSLPAQALVPLLDAMSFDGLAAKAVGYFKDWDYQLLPNSITAAIYVSWENQLKENAHQRFVADAGKPYINSLQLKRIVDWVTQPTAALFGNNPVEARDAFLRQNFEEAIASLAQRLGDDPSKWQYGQAVFKHSAIDHALGNVVQPDLANRLNHPPIARGGNAYTPGSTGSNDRQSSGATFRILVDTQDWDTALGTNSPGQSGDPDSPFYDNLYEDWAADRFFPVFFSKGKIEKVAHDRTLLIPLKSAN
ncbi:MAG: penicillin acylase family protein, partial [Flavobacteriaceae bacterium]